MADFKNTHLSFSRLSRFEQCALAFKLHYVDRQQAEPGLPLRFGKAVHAVLEVLVREHVDEERTGPLSAERAAELWQQTWSSEGLTGLELFQEGLDILQRFVVDQGSLDCRDVLAVEKEFHLAVGPFTVLGFIDRVDRLGDDGVEVIDLKTNRMLFGRDEVESSLQLGLYALAAQQLWPWAKKVKLTYHMLRHGLRQTTERTPEQLDGVRRYVETLGRQTETATEFPPRLNANCCWCDHRRQCPAYADALRGKRDVVCEDLDDLETVSREREEVARLAKILGQRKDELDGVIKAHLKDKDELVLAGTRYAMFTVTSLSHPLEPTLAVLGRATGLGREELLSRLAVIDKKALDELVKEVGQDRARARLLKTELENVAVATHSTRLWAKAAKEVAE